MGAHDQRPRFYEGQFLSAADLAAVIDYQRTAQARHTLGAHTWGIALGLTLRERPAPGAANRVEVIVNPGIAWDGFGRAIVVDRPTRVAEELFADIAFAAAADAPPAPQQPKGRLVKLWIAYDEIGAKPPAPGFQACTDDDQSSRVRESFRLVGGEQPELSARRAPVTIGTTVIDAEAVLSEFDSTAPGLWDTSVPHQTFPANGRPPQWLVPLGYVRWIARDGDLGYFARVDLDPADKAADRTRALRRYLGVVAQNVEAADGAVVLRARSDPPLKAGSLMRRLASGDAWTQLSQDMTWIEGNARVVGDLKLAGGALRFRNVDGGDEATALDLVRFGDGAVDAGNRELRAVLGDTGQIDNRLIVGPLRAGTTNIEPRLSVVSGAGATKKDAEGRVGINTRDPRAALEVNGDWDGAEDGAVRVGGSSATVRMTHGLNQNDPSWRLQVGAEDNSALRAGYRTTAPGWKDVLWVTRQNSVGVGSGNPRNPLAVRAQGDWHDLVSFEDPGGATRWHLNMKALGNAPGNVPGLNFSETGVADFRLFLKAGGDVGVGTMAPKGRLTIDGKLQPAQGQLTVFSSTADVEYDGGNDHLFRFLQSPSGVTSFMGAKVGIGTELPRNPLAVRAVDASEELVSFETPSGDASWHINQAFAGTPQRGLNFVRTGVAGGDGRLFLGENGNVGIGTTDPGDRLQVEGNFLTVKGIGGERAVVGGEGISGVVFGTRNPAVAFADMRRMNVAFGQFNDAAWLEVWCKDVHEVSDARAKSNVEPLRAALAQITQLRGVSFRWRSDVAEGRDQPRLGLIAQEVQKIVPEAVTVNERGAGISYSSLIPLLIEAIKELKDEVDTLRKDMNAIAARKARPAQKK